MDSMPINWETLDALIIDFAKSENLIEDSSSSPPSSPSSVSSSSYHSRRVIRRIRRSLEAGDIDAAVDLLRSHAPFVLDDHRLLFRLQKQVRRAFEFRILWFSFVSFSVDLWVVFVLKRFIELLRRGSPEARESAISCLRTALAPCALDAYPVRTLALFFSTVNFVTLLSFRNGIQCLETKTSWIALLLLCLFNCGCWYFCCIWRKRMRSSSMYY